jgi:hypothetical protein
VDYEITVELADDVQVNEVNVDHVEGGGFGIAWETSEASPSASIEDSSIETVDAGCASGDSDSVEAKKSGRTVSLDGVLSSPNPCHEAVIGSESVSEGALSVTIDVKSTLDEGEMCQDCLGAVDYEATFELTGDVEVTSVEVTHATGETHTASFGD